MLKIPDFFKHLPKPLNENEKNVIIIMFVLAALGLFFSILLPFIL